MGDHYNREQHGAVVVQEGGKTGWDWCSQLCDYFGLEGCCLWDDVKDECFFVAHQFETTDSPGYSTKTFYKGGGNWKHVKFPHFQAGICRTPGCTEVMSAKMDRRSECFWDGADKAGRKGLNGAKHSPEECENFCLGRPECIISALSSTGYRHTFATCNVGQAGGTGWTVKQKICKQNTLALGNTAQLGDMEAVVVDEHPHSLIVFAFAALGFGTILYGAGQFYCSKENESQQFQATETI